MFLKSTHMAGPYRVEPREVKARMDTATVRAILNMGYSKDLVRMAIEKRLSTTGNGDGRILGLCCGILNFSVLKK